MDNLTATLMIVGGVAVFLAVQILLLSLLKKNRAALVVVAVVFYVLGMWLCVRISGGKLSALGDIVGLASIFNYLEDYSAIFPNLAIALLPLLYAVILSSAIACVRSVIDSKLADEEEV